MRRAAQVLLADHDGRSRWAIQRELQQAGFEVHLADTGAEAILYCEIDPPDILVVELNLPDIDGFEVCEHARREARDRDLTIIVTAGAVDTMKRSYLGQMAEYVGADYFLAKPCDARLILRVLENFALARETPNGPHRQALAFPTRAIWPTSRVISSATVR